MLQTLLRIAILVAATISLVVASFPASAQQSIGGRIVAPLKGTWLAAEADNPFPLYGDVFQLTADFEFEDSTKLGWKIPAGTHVRALALPDLTRERFRGILQPAAIAADARTQPRAAVLLYEHFAAQSSRSYTEVVRAAQELARIEGVNSDDAGRVFNLVEAFGPRWSVEQRSNFGGLTSTRVLDLGLKQGEPRLASVDLGTKRVASQPLTASDPCQNRTLCTQVPVFFGTSRRVTGTGRTATFPIDTDGKLHLGRAFVTVPKSARPTGSIPRPWLGDGDPLQHLTLLRDETQVYASEQDFLTAVRTNSAAEGKYKDHAFVFVHGFRVPFEAALYRTAQIAHDLGEPDANGMLQPYGTAFLFSWPSAGSMFAYTRDQERALNSATRLREFLELLVARSGIKRVHLIAHSLGNVTVLNALKELSLSNPKQVSFQQIVLAAPDVEREAFAGLAENATRLAKGVTLYASRNDWAMYLSRILPSSAPRAGDIVDGRPVLAQGLFSLDISSLSTTIFSIAHSEYADNRHLVNDLGRLLKFDEQPPHLRDRNFWPVPEGNPAYWVYKP